MKSFSRFGLVLSLVLAVVTLGPAWAVARDDCAEGKIRAGVDALGGYEVWEIKNAAPGVLVALKKDGEPGILMIGMASVEPDLVTSQFVRGREGGSTLNQAESEWTNKLFDSLYPDASFRACQELRREKAAEPDQMSVAMDTFWKELNKVNEGSDSSGSWLILLFVAVGIAFAAVVVVLIVVRKRGRKPAGEPSPDTAEQVPAEPSEETAAAVVYEEPVAVPDEEEPAPEKNDEEPGEVV